MKYVARAIEPELKKAVRQFPVLVLTGPRQTGKSTLLKHLFKKYKYLTFDDPSLRYSAKKDPGLFIENLGLPVILDEIQYAPELLPYIKIAVDQTGQRKGQFILTGSQIFPLMAGISESLAGRAVLFELLGFSWEELKKIPEKASDCYSRMQRGFYPVPALRKIDARNYYGSYIAAYLERDIRQVQNVHDMVLFQKFLQLTSARAGNILNLNEIGKECGITFTTARRWLSLLESTRIVYLLRPYYRNVSKRVVKSPKLYFTDTGLLAYLLKYGNKDTLMAGPQAGAFFENMVIAEVLKRKFNHNLRYELYFYRDTNGNEADMVLDYGDKIVIAEIKSAKTITPKFADFAGRIPIRKSQAYLLSFYNQELNLTGNVKAVPWWKFNP